MVLNTVLSSTIFPSLFLVYPLSFFLSLNASLILLDITFFSIFRNMCVYTGLCEYAEKDIHFVSLNDDERQTLFYLCAALNLAVR